MAMDLDSTRWRLLIFVLTWLAKRRHRDLDVKKPGTLPKLPGTSHIVTQERRATFADSLSRLLDDGVPLEESLRLAATSSGEADLSEGARGVAAAIKQGTFPVDDSSIALRFPPFLRWAIWHAEESTGRARALQMAATIYRESAERRIDRLQIVAPMLACAILGGGATMLYGLALFVPVIDMLLALAIPR